MASAPERCAPAAERRGDDLFATAAPAERFVLVEEPGAWGRNALRESRLDTSVLAGLLARCHSANARLLLIRRAHRPTESRSWAIADARPGSEATWWGTFEADDELCDLDPGAPSGTPTDAPTFLVCTHGRRDPCCAGRGWPVAVALTAELPDQTWQCSHVGGDRFAANVVILPHGLYYGHVTPGRRGRDRARGTSRDASPSSRSAGARPSRPRRRQPSTSPGSSTGWTAIDALRPLDVAGRADGAVVVRLAVGEGVRSVVLREHESEPISRLTCGARVATPIREWELVDLQ